MFNKPFDIAKARILVSNDDGVHATGIKILERIAHTLSNDVWVVAPESEQSAVSHSLTIRRPLRIRQYVDVLDGLVLQGGADMSPQSYGETPLDPRWSGDEVRDAYEIELFHEFVTQGKPVFGICRGHQVINVALGGSLFQDIPTQRPGPAVHRDEARSDQCFHDVRVLPGSWLARLYPGVDTTRVNTVHHQAVNRLGEGLVVEAVGADDGVVEAIRWEGHSFVVGVQWHPEWMNPGDPALLEGEPLRRAFLAACEERRRTGKASPVSAVRAA